MQTLHYELLELNEQIESAQADLDADDSDASSRDEAPSLGWRHS